MRKPLYAVALIGIFSLALPVAAQQPCTGFSVVVNTPEDQLMLAVNGAENPQEQVAALNKFAQVHPDSKFMPCVNEYYTAAYLKLNNYDKAIEYGEKDLAANYQDLNLILNLTKAYVASSKVSDPAFDIILKAPEQIKAESNSPKPPNVSDAEWQKAQQELAQQTKDNRAYLEYAFFQLLPRVADASKRLRFLDGFMKSYPDTTNVGQVNLQYFIAYKMANNPAKADEYGEKAIALDPTNVAALNLVADEYATRRTNLDQAAAYAKKVTELAPAMKKPEGMSEDQFKIDRDNQLGLAHITLGYVEFQRASKTRKVASAIQHFKTAVDLLNGNSELQARALYFMGSAYEFEYPPNHRGAFEALTRASSLQSSWQGQARDLLAKVKRAVER